jgi:predicted metal-dependent phosphoesterase TrpH
VPAVTGVRLYHEAGYTGIIVTDHYSRRFFKIHPFSKWERRIDFFLKGYRSAFAEGERLGMDIQLGMELRFDENPNDYLVYGISEEFLKSHKKLYRLGLKGFRKLIAGSGIVIVQAHPFRTNMVTAAPELIDGVEVYNGNPRHDSANHLAEKYAREHGLKMLSGSDFHQPVDAGRGGIIVEERIKNGSFAEAIKNDKILDIIRT